jgi:hypothetical protein
MVKHPLEGNDAAEDAESESRESGRRDDPIGDAQASAVTPEISLCSVLEGETASGETASILDIAVLSLLAELRFPAGTQTSAVQALGPRIADAFRDTLDPRSSDAGTAGPREIDEDQLLKLINSALAGLAKAGTVPVSRVIEEEAPEHCPKVSGLMGPGV